MKFNLALTGILFKIFVKGFFKAHAGQLLFLFVTILSYLFYIQVLSDDHLSLSETILNNLLLVLTIISSPVMAILLMSVWLIFTFKSWAYITNQIFAPNNYFLFYSANSFDKTEQFKSWFLVQLGISLPILVYGIFSFVVGIIFGFYLIPILIFVFIFLISAISAAIYMFQLNETIKINNNSSIFRLFRNWEKPIFSLFIFYIFDKIKITFLATKIVSILLIIGLYFLLSDFNINQNIAIIALFISISNTVLIFESYRFENKYLRFLLNFPLPEWQVYFFTFLTYLILIFPEVICLIIFFQISLIIKAILLILSTTLLFKGILFYISLNMKKYLYWVFMLFIMLTIGVQFGGFLVLALINFIVSTSVFYLYYYKQKILIN